MLYRFYGADSVGDLPLNPNYPKTRNPKDLYDAFSKAWCRETCAPRMQPEWSEANMTLGQCSISSLIVQDLYGGEIYGILLPSGAYHCFNKIGDMVFDLTSEQFGDVVLDYSHPVLQSREEHLRSPEKKARYELLKKRLLAQLK